MKLFIDANIYIPFYNSNAGNLRKLLATLDEIHEDIIVTKIIADEVARNGFNQFKASFENYAKSAIIKDFNLPIHIGAGLEDKLLEWNKARTEITKNADKTNKLFHEIRNLAINEVYKGSDQVTKTFRKIFENALIPSEEEYRAAEVRKATGNPPGKRKDPIGDELSWEQLLNELKGVDKLWIVTNDNDYCIDWNKKEKMLQPILRTEVLSKYPKLEIEFHDDLAQAIKSFNDQKVEKLKTIPSDNELNEISEEMSESMKALTEAAINLGKASREIPMNVYKLCTFCNKRGNHYLDLYSFKDEGKTFGYICENCNR